MYLLINGNKHNREATITIETQKTSGRRRSPFAYRYFSTVPVSVLFGTAPITVSIF